METEYTPYSSVESERTRGDLSTYCTYCEVPSLQMTVSWVCHIVFAVRSVSRKRLNFSRSAQSWQCCHFCIAYMRKSKVSSVKNVPPGGTELDHKRSQVQSSLECFYGKTRLQRSWSSSLELLIIKFHIYEILCDVY